ncbi:MAG: hypothetical protein H6Q49_1964 [Deltaproteobacteria bacterium]|nr:hypothetical protein [Deltaproteobacteria bacterium]
MIVDKVHDTGAKKTGTAGGRIFSQVTIKQSTPIYKKMPT